MNLLNRFLLKCYSIGAEEEFRGFAFVAGLLIVLYCLTR